MMRRVPQEAVLSTEYSFRTGNACFLHRMPLKMRRVPQEPVLSTARIFRTIEGPLRYRMPQTAERRRALPVANDAKPKMKRALPAASTTNTRNEKALPAASITNTRKEKVLPATNATTARKEVFPLTQREGQCEKRSPPHRGKQKENDIKNRSLSNLGCDVGLEPTTPRTTIWCSTN